MNNEILYYYKYDYSPQNPPKIKKKILGFPGLKGNSVPLVSIHGPFDSMLNISPQQHTSVTTHSEESNHGFQFLWGTHMGDSELSNCKNWNYT